MRLKFLKLSFLLVFVNVVIVYYSWKLFIAIRFNDNKTETNSFSNKSIKHVSRLVTVIIRDVEINNNDISSTVESILHAFPNIQILIVTNGLPYPPLRIFQLNTTSKNVKLINTQHDFKVEHLNKYPLSHVNTPFVLFVPDSSRINNRHFVNHMLTELITERRSMVASPFGDGKDLICLNANISQREWKIKFNRVKNDQCDVINGKHVLLVETNILRKLNDAFLLPFPLSVYLQTSVLRYKVIRTIEL